MMFIDENLFDFSNSNKSIVLAITQWNYWRTTQRCIDSIRKYTDLDNVNLIIMDDCSDDNEAIKWLSETKEKVIRADKNYQHNSLVRQLLDFLKDKESIKYTCVMNNDILVTKDWLKNMISCMDTDGNIALMGSKDNNDYHMFQNFPIPNEVRPDENGYVFGDDIKLQEYIDREFYAKRKSNIWVQVQTIDGNVMLFRNSIIKKIGSLNPEFDDYAGDSEFFLKVNRNGYKVAYCLSSFVYHLGGGQAGKYISFLKNYHRPLADAAKEKAVLIYNRYGIDITTHGRASNARRQEIIDMEKKMVE